MRYTRERRRKTERKGEGVSRKSVTVIHFLSLSLPVF